MEELKLLTIYNSLRNYPTILLTKKGQYFRLVQQYSQKFLLNYNIYVLLLKHFKIPSLQAGTFAFQNIKYFCEEAVEGAEVLNSWSGYRWQSKRGYNQFANPNIVFKILLLQLYFPIFDGVSTLILPGKKDLFVSATYPYFIKENTIKFKQKDLYQLGMFTPEFKQLFTYLKKELFQIVESFSALHHEKLYQQLKYQVSLFPDIRNEIWDELKPCFSPDFLRNASLEVKNFILKL